MAGNRNINTFGMSLPHGRGDRLLVTMSLPPRWVHCVHPRGDGQVVLPSSCTQCKSITYIDHHSCTFFFSFENIFIIRNIQRWPCPISFKQIIGNISHLHWSMHNKIEAKTHQPVSDDLSTMVESWMLQCCSTKQARNKGKCWQHIYHFTQSMTI